MTASWVALLCKLILFLHLFTLIFSYIFILIHIHHPTSPKIKNQKHILPSRKKKKQPIHPTLKERQQKKQTSVYDAHLPTSIASFRVLHRLLDGCPPWYKVLLSEWFDNNRLLDLFASMPLRGDPSERSSEKTAEGWNYSFKWQIHVLLFFLGKWGGNLPIWVFPGI